VAVTNEVLLETQFAEGRLDAGRQRIVGGGQQLNGDSVTAS
jgi:hypothetical protein